MLARPTWLSVLIFSWYSSAHVSYSVCALLMHGACSKYSAIFFVFDFAFRCVTEIIKNSSWAEKLQVFKIPSSSIYKYIIIVNIECNETHSGLMTLKLFIFLSYITYG